MKKIFKGLLVLVFLLIGGFLFFKTTPKYTLVKLVKAYRTHDIELARQYMDIDGLASQVADEAARLLQEEVDKPSTSQDEWESLGEEIGRMMLQGFIPKLKETVENEMKKAIIESIEGIEGKGVDKTPAFQSLSWKDLLPGGRVTVRKEGVIRLITIPSQKGKEFVFRMRKEDGKWRIVKWENFGDIVKDFTNEETKAESVDLTKRVKFGERVDITSGWYLIVNASEAYSPTSIYDQADKGNKLVTIEVIYENTSSSEGSYDASNFGLKDDEDHRYKREYSSKQPELDYGTLPPGEKVKGFITYEIPDKAEVVGVIYSSSSGGTIVFEENEN